MCVWCVEGVGVEGQGKEDVRNMPTPPLAVVTKPFKSCEVAYEFNYSTVLCSPNNLHTICTNIPLY